MGVKDATKTFKASGQVQLKDTAEEDYAVDAFIELFRTGSMQHIARLTNPAGEPTAHLTICLANVIKRKAIGGDDIWCFDSRDPRHADDPKQRTLDDRAEVRKNNEQEMKNIAKEITKLEEMAGKIKRDDLLKVDPTFDATLKSKRDEYEMLKARNPDARHFSKRIVDIMYILTKLGVRQAIAPPGVDAEKLGAFLTEQDIVDGVITTDTDSIFYGAKKQLKKKTAKAATKTKDGKDNAAVKSGTYDVYILEDCMAQYKNKDGKPLTRQQMAQIASVLGCDFCEGTRGVGAKTVVKKVLDGTIQYTKEQIAAQEKFLDDTPIKYEHIEPNCSNESLDELKDWLVKVQGFKLERVIKMLKPFYL